jgi:hypothetical protein
MRPAEGPAAKSQLITELSPADGSEHDQKAVATDFTESPGGMGTADQKEPQSLEKMGHQDQIVQYDVSQADEDTSGQRKEEREHRWSKTLNSAARPRECPDQKERNSNFENHITHNPVGVHDCKRTGVDFSSDMRPFIDCRCKGIQKVCDSVPKRKVGTSPRTLGSLSFFLSDSSREDSLVPPVRGITTCINQPIRLSSSLGIWSVGLLSRATKLTISSQSKLYLGIQHKVV